MRATAVMLALLLWSCRDSPQGQAADEVSAGGASGQSTDGGGLAGGGGAPRGGDADAGDASQAAGGASGRAGAAGAPAGGSGDGAGIAEPDAASADARADAETADATAPAPSCLDDITNYTEPGPFEFHSASVGQVKLWVPEVTAGCKVPVVHVANGTGSTCASFAGIIEQLASHGFLTVCYEHPQPDDGTRCLHALQAAFSEYPDLADTKIGSTGYETGGAVAIMCVYRAEQEWGATATYAGHAMAPASGFGGMGPDWQAHYGEIRSPMFVANTSQANLVSSAWVEMGYELLASEKYWYEASGATDLPIPISWAAESAVVFFRWKLLADEAAGAYFAAMPDSDRWDLRAQDPGP